MANIYVPNIIITQDYKLINKIMESEYLDVTQNFEEDRAILLSTRQNKYVYGLEHSINFDESDSKITLRILDVDNDFENKFFNESFFEMMMNEQVSTYIKNNEKISEFGNYFSKALNSQIRIYMAYGIGNELANWSNPMTCVLFGARIDLANNGLRTYTYEFTPEVNYFFKYPTIEFDKYHPNDNLNLTFGAATSRTWTRVRAPMSKAKEITLIVRSLLTNFVSKVTNVSRGNVIALIPDIDSKGSNASLEIDKLHAQWKAANKDKRPKDSPYIRLKENKKNVDWTNIIEIFMFYHAYFKNIYCRKPDPTNCTYPIINKKYKKLPLKEDVLTELNSKLAKKKKTSENSFREDQKLVSDLEGELTEIKRNKAELEAFPSKPSRERAIDKYNQRISELEGKLKEAKEDRDGSKMVYDKQITSLEKNILSNKLASEIIDDINKQRTFSDTQIAPTQTYQELTWELVATPDPNRSKDSNTPEIPDWYRAIQNVFLGIASLYGEGDSYIVPHVSYESDAKFLKLFHKHGLIRDPSVPCVIVGDRQMVLDYIYRNQVPASKMLDNKSKFSINKKDDLYKILNNIQYAIDLKNLIGRKKNSSSFNEKIILDELSIDNNSSEEASVIRDATKIIEQQTEADDIPVFLNNFKNSNVLSYTVKNTESYMAVTKKAVVQNRFKTLLGQLSEDKLSKVLLSGGLGQYNDLTPATVARILFKDTVGILTENTSPDKKLPQGIISVFNQAETIKDILKESIEAKEADADILSNLSKYEDEKFKYRSGKNTKVLDSIITGHWIQEINYDRSSEFDAKIKQLKKDLGTLSDEDRSILKILYDSKLKSGVSPIFSNSQESVTIINALLQANLAQIYPKIPKENLLPLADTIILMNAANINSENAQVDATPGLYLPNQNFILGKITDYAMRNFVQVSIKTLPFFYLSNYRVIGQPSLLYSKKVNISNYDNQSIFDFFSGNYTILGFKHVITTKECYSEFILTKSQALGGEVKSI